MFLKRFTRPKWQHPDAEIRRQALATLAPDDPALQQVVLDDTEAAVRAAAVCACSCIDTVTRAWRNDVDAGVRNTALRRLGLLLAGRVEAGELPAWLTLVGEIDAPEVLAQIARQARASELRRCAIERIDDPDVLVQIAQEDELAELRLLALERIDSATVLQDLARSCRGRDKRLYRRARELADAAIECQQRPIRILALCEAMEKLVAGEATLAHDAIKALTDEWASLVDAAGNEQRERFETATVAAEQALSEQQQLRQRKHAQEGVCQQLHALLAAHRQRDELNPEQAAEFDTALATLETEWREAGGDSDEAHPEHRKTYADLRQRLHEQHQHLLQRHERAESIRLQLERGQRWLADNKLTPRRASEWAEQFAALPLPGDSGLAQDLRARGKDLGQRLREQAQSLTARKEQAGHALLAQIEELSTLLAQGQLQPAINRFNAVRNKLAEIGPLAGDKQGQVDRRLQQANTRIRELRDWRRWGSNQAREELIEEAEALVGSTLEPPRLAEQIRGLRAKWQKLDRTDSATNEALWERFNQLCSQAYEPCQAFFDEQGRERRARIDARERICASFSDWADSIDWEQPAWREIDRRLKQFRREWRDAAEVHGRDRRMLEERFHQLLDQVEQRLAPERERNHAERRQLVEQAAALADAEDVRSAIDQAKQLQQQWVVTVAARRRHEDQKLWQAFRKHIDAVFARRDAEANAGRIERDAAVTALQTLIEQLESAARDAQDEDGLRQALRDAERAKRELAELPRNRERELERRFEQARANVDQAQRSLARDRELAALDACAVHSRLYAQLEDGLLSGAVGDIEQKFADHARQADQLPALAAADRERFERRLHHARQIATQPDKAAGLLAQNAAALEALTLQLEILAGVESPAEFQRDRLAMQVDRLSAVMGEGAGDSDGRQTGIMPRLHEWHGIGPVAGDVRQRLQERIERIRGSLV